MNRMQSLFFGVTSLFYIVFVEVLPISSLFKIVPILILFFVLFQKKSNLWSLIAVILCGLGDLFLAINFKDYFIFGLASFLLAHIFYILSFYKLPKNKFKISQKYSLPIKTLILIIGTLFYIKIFPNLESMKIPVLFYFLVIVLMNFVAINKLGWIGLTGALVFLISDSLIAYSLFVESFAHSQTLIMLTYYLAQYLIVSSLILVAKDNYRSQIFSQD
jgi:alkenylglycerophosphocholine/alkenylglycerophosphoethanolamine hydrolase